MCSLTKVSGLFRYRIGCVLFNNFGSAYYSTPPAISSLGKAAKKVKQAGVSLEKRVIPVETDTNKLVKYVCGSNIYKEGSDVELKPDSEYPDWLWELEIGKPKRLDELDPNTIRYWKKVRCEGMKKKNKLISLRKGL